jgi:hypothetical protein
VTAVVGCTYCGGVEAPAWFTSSDLWVVVGALVVVGAVVGVVGLVRDAWPGRTGALRIGLGLGVLVPLAVVVATSGDARVDVEVAGRAPFDADAWSVSCDTFQEAPTEGEVLPSAFHDACVDATRPARWATVALGAIALGLALDGGRRLLPRPRSIAVAPLG